MSRGVLVDTTLCTGCRGCQVACKQQNKLPPEETTFFAKAGGYQNPADLSARTYSLVTFNEVENKNGHFDWVFARRQCMHCEEPSCVSACLVGALSKTESGAVVYDETKCIGCRYCLLSCPFGVPSFEWEKTVPFVRKCTFCFTRQAGGDAPATVNGKALDSEQRARHKETQTKPACTKACHTGALMFGEREELLVEARNRIRKNPKRYVNHIYGEKEAGGTSWLYLAGVSFKKLGFPMHLGERSFPSYAKAAKDGVPHVMLGVGAMLGGFYWYNQRCAEVAKKGE
ncbi:MAG: 4Fe-4S dicluster domain-containing protein [bacterium]|nr:4Fe-4S dicluster domain-containing protein [bacterium]